MNNPKVVLVSPPNHFTQDPPAPSLSLAVLSGVLSSGGVNHVCLDGNLFNSWINLGGEEEDVGLEYLRKVCSRILELEPDILGISTWGVTLPFTLLLTEMVKQEQGELPVIIGGIRSRREALEVIEWLWQRTSSVEAIVLGEADPFLPQLIRLLTASGKQKLLGGEMGGEAIRIETVGPTALYRFPPAPQEEWGRASYDHFSDSVGRKFFVEGSRGCGHSCIFCSANSGPLRRKPPQDLVGEMEELKKRRAPLFLNFADNTFPLAGPWIEGFCKAYLEKEINIPWAALARTERIDPEALSLMKEAGCVNLFLGVETPNPRTLAYIRKTSNPEEYASEIEKNLDTILRSGISIIASTIIGFPGETAEEMMRTVDFVKALRKKGVTAYTGPLVVYSGSPLWEEYEAGRLGLFQVRNKRIRRNHPGIGAPLFQDNPVFVPNNFLPVNHHLSKNDLEKTLLSCYEALEE